MARIVTVYNTERDVFSTPRDMAHIRWIKISEALARLGHQVDIASGELGMRLTGKPVQMAPNLRRVPLTRVKWHEYDVVKTLFHQGFDTLQRLDGGAHPFIIAKLGSVVGPVDMPGIYFYGAQRERMMRTQMEIQRRARYITVLSPPAQSLWERSVGHHPGFLLVPGAADADMPAPDRDPFPSDQAVRCVFSGNLYSSQPEATRVLSDKLSELGSRLAPRGRVFVVGLGDRSQLDPRWVTHLGSVAYHKSWDHLHFANVGVVVSAGTFMHNNESTKIYHYLRAGLPAVVEAGFPNDHVVSESGLGHVVTNGDMGALADAVIDAAARTWDRASAQRFILEHHTWDIRAQVYQRVLAQHFP